MLEKSIAYHCAPALAGIKPSNIVACYKNQYPDIHSDIARLNEQMNPAGIYFDVLCECEKRVLLMVYRRDRLERCLREEEIGGYLRSLGYPSEYSLDAYLNELRRRLGGSDFPHEIGAFLGYPLCDILGFVNHEQCIFTGDRKVYRDAEGAKILFNRYKCCRCALMKRIERGATLARLFCVA